MARTKAYVLMEVIAGHVPTVAAALRGMPGLVSVDSVMGPFDIILVVLADDLTAVGDLVTEHVHSISGVVRAVTCVVMG